MVIIKSTYVIAKSQANLTAHNQSTNTLINQQLMIKQ